MSVTPTDATPPSSTVMYVDNDEPVTAPMEGLALLPSVPAGQLPFFVARASPPSSTTQSSTTSSSGDSKRTTVALEATTTTTSSSSSTSSNGRPPTGRFVCTARVRSNYGVAFTHADELSQVSMYEIILPPRYTHNNDPTINDKDDAVSWQTLLTLPNQPPLSADPQVSVSSSTSNDAFISFRHQCKPLTINNSHPLTLSHRLTFQPCYQRPYYDETLGNDERCTDLLALQYPSRLLPAGIHIRREREAVKIRRQLAKKKQIEVERIVKIQPKKAASSSSNKKTAKKKKKIKQRRWQPTVVRTAVFDDHSNKDNDDHNDDDDDDEDDEEDNEGDPDTDEDDNKRHEVKDGGDPDEDDTDDDDDDDDDDDSDGSANSGQKRGPIDSSDDSSDDEEDHSSRSDRTTLMFHINYTTWYITPLLAAFSWQPVSVTPSAVLLGKLSSIYRYTLRSHKHLNVIIGIHSPSGRFKFSQFTRISDLQTKLCAFDRQKVDHFCST
jgi:hypothetical protein